MNEHHDLDDPHPGKDRPVAGWPAHGTGEAAGEHTLRPADEPREGEEPPAGDVRNLDVTGWTEPARRARTGDDGHVTEPFGTEEPMVVSEPAAEQGSEAVTIVPAAGTADTAVVAAESAGTGTAPEMTAGEFDVDHLVEPDAAERLRDRWREVKSAFVDDPSDAVRQAGDLAGEAVEELTAALGRLRQELDGAWGEGTDTDTERLRVALRGYGSLIDRVLAH